MEERRGGGGVGWIYSVGVGCGCVESSWENLLKQLYIKISHFCDKYSYHSLFSSPRNVWKHF